MPRRRNTTTQITDLKETIMLKILGHLDLKSAIRTCAATSRWRMLLCKLRALEFDIDDFPVTSLRVSCQKQCRLTFTTAVTHLLAIQDGRKPLERFSIRYNLRQAPIRQEINYWLKTHGQRLRIEEICIDVDAGPSTEYRLNFNQYSIPSVKVLQIRGCRFNQLCTSADVPSLTNFAIAKCHVTFHFLRSLLRDLPLLQTLAISDCSSLGMVHPIEAPHVRNFFLRGRPPFPLDMPNLQYQEVEDVLHISLDGRPTALLDIDPWNPSTRKRRKFIISYAISRLRAVRSLILTARTLVVFGRWYYQYLLLDCILSNVKKLEVHGARLAVEETRGLGALLGRCSNIRSIKFEMDPSEGGMDPRFVLGNVRVALRRLRTLTVERYGAYQRDEELVRYFLKKARRLTSISISPMPEVRHSRNYVHRLMMAAAEHRASRPARPPLRLEFPGWELD